MKLANVFSKPSSTTKARLAYKKTSTTVLFFTALEKILVVQCKLSFPALGACNPALAFYKTAFSEKNLKK